MAKFTTVSRAVEAGLKEAKSGLTFDDIGIHASGRRIRIETGEAIGKAVGKRAGFVQKFGTRGGQVAIAWHGERMQKIMAAKFKTRLRVASQLVKDQTKRNLSVPVLKYKGAFGTMEQDPKTGKMRRVRRTQVLKESRSRRGEFPRADTTRLMKDVFNEVISDTQAVVGTTLDYGLILETRMNRSFLRRTLQEMQSTVQRILTAKMDM